jgi:hypothetical protein
MKLSTSVLKGVVCYLLSVAILFSLIAKAKTHLRAGEQVAFGRSFTFYLKASEKKGDHYIVTPELAKEIEKALAFKMDSQTTFQPTSIEVKAQEVSWKEGKTSYTVSGGRITFAGQLTAAAEPSSVEQPLLIVLPELGPGDWQFPNGGARGRGQVRTVKNFLVHPTAEAVQSANVASAAKSAGGPALVAWAVWLLISAARAKSRRARATEPLEQVQLPRTFEPNVPHIASSFGIAALIGGIVACILLFAGMNDPGSRLSETLAMASAGAALAVALLVAWIAARGVVGAEVSLESLIVSRGLGRGRRREMTWDEIDAAKPVEARLPSGRIKKEYLDVMPAGARKPLRIGADQIAEYGLFRELTCALWQRKHPTPPARTVA